MERLSNARTRLGLSKESPKLRPRKEKKFVGIAMKGTWLRPSKSRTRLRSRNTWHEAMS